MGIIFALAYAIFVAIGKNLLKKSFEQTSSSIGFAVETFFGCLIWIPFAFISGINFAAIPQILPVVMISAILSEAYIFYIYTKGDVSIVATVFSSYSIYTILFSRIINNEILKPNEMFFVSICIIGTLIISIPKNLKLKQLASSKAALWGLSGAIVVGFSDTISKTQIDNTSASTFLLCLALCQIPVALAYTRLEKINLVQISDISINKTKHKFLLISGFTIALGQLFFWLAFEGTLASIASPLTSSQVIFVVIIAWIFLKEKIEKKNILGIVFVILGILGIAVVSR